MFVHYIIIICAILCVYVNYLFDIFIFGVKTLLFLIILFGENNRIFKESIVSFPVYRYCFETCIKV